MTDAAASLRPFLKTLGVRLSTVDSEAACAEEVPTCATFDQPRMTLTVCDQLCSGRRTLAINRVLERL